MGAKSRNPTKNWNHGNEAIRFIGINVGESSQKPGFLTGGARCV